MPQSPMSAVMQTLRGVCCAWGCLLVAGAWAQDVAGDEELLRLARRWVDGAVAQAQSPGKTPLRMEVSLGPLDSRLRLAPCSRIEPFLPVGTRLWGRTRVGLRCLEGPVRWSVFLPVTVKAHGLAWVVRQDLAAGAVLTAADLMQAEADWAQEPSPVLSAPEQWVGQVAARALGTGQVLRQNMVRPAQVFQAGAQVRVVAVGNGFQITGDGQALGTGIVGQQVKVRMDNGRVMSGLVLDSHTVKLEI